MLPDIPNSKKPKKYVKVGDWKKAVEIWTQLTRSSNPKIAAMAAHNMAVAAEREGLIDVALDWANKAYQNFGLRREHPYVNQLQNRKMQMQQLKEQLPNVDPQKR